MRCFRLPLILPILFATTDTILMAQQHPPVTVIRLYTGPDGMSHFERIDVKFAPIAGMLNGVEQSESSTTSKSYIVRATAGYFDDWHNADVRRYVITISGRAEIEVAGRRRFVAQPGEIVLAEDLTGKGHTFRVLGDADWVAMFVDLGK